jgi:hypothetical protein
MGFVVDRVLPGLIWVFAVVAMAVGMAFILSRTVSRIHNRPSRFVVLFVLGVPFGMAYGYSKVWLLGHTTMSPRWSPQFRKHTGSLFAGRMRKTTTSFSHPISWAAKAIEKKSGVAHSGRLSRVCDCLSERP